jgi:hypothetical protein
MPLEHAAAFLKSTGALAGQRRFAHAWVVLSGRARCMHSAAHAEAFCANLQQTGPCAAKSEVPPAAVGECRAARAPRNQNLQKVDRGSF